jgi:hypothetical protein
VILNRLIKIVKYIQDIEFLFIKCDSSSGTVFNFILFTYVGFVAVLDEDDLTSIILTGVCGLLLHAKNEVQ